jgi:hypothetical protein
MLPAVDVTAAIVLVVEAAHNAGHRSSTKLVAALRRPRVIDDRIRIREDSADERNPLAIGRPLRQSDTVVDEAQLLGRTRGRGVDDEELVGGSDLADESDLAAVWRPLGIPVTLDAAGRLNGFRIEKTADDDAVSSLPGVGVGPGDLIGDTLTVRAQTNVVDPAKSV